MRIAHWIKQLTLVAALALGAGLAVGCQQDDASDHFQRAGEEIGEGVERGVEQTGEAVEELGEEIQN